MKYSHILPAVSLLFLAACSSTSSGGTSVEEKLKNPLYAQKYYEDLVDHMVSLQIHNDPILKNNQTKSLVDSVRANSVKQAQDAARQKNGGLRGVIQSDSDEAQGDVLVLNDALYIGPDFYMTPGPSTHVYLTSVVDPRTANPFPDATAADLGEVQDPYGAQTFALPKTDDKHHTVVFFDTKMKRIFGFAQLGN